MLRNGPRPNDRRRLPLTSLARGALAALAFASGAAAQPPDDTISIGIGETRTIRVPSGTKIVNGDTSVMVAKDIGGGQLAITGNAEGRASLVLVKPSGPQARYLVVVRKVSVPELVKNVKALLGERPGINVRVVGDAVFLEGKAYTREDSERVARVVELSPAVRSFVTVAPEAIRLVASSLNDALQRERLRNVQATAVGNTILLEGSVESAQDLQKAELITRAFGEKVENLVVVGIKRMIMVEVQFVEIRRSEETQVGVKLPTAISSSNSTVGLSLGKELFKVKAPTGALTALLAGSTNWSAGLRFDDGYGRLLAQPKLVCASGEKAKFHAGGEIPIVVSDGTRLHVEFKPFGIMLNVKPTADRHGNVQTEIESEVSDVDRSIAVEFNGFSVPGFRTRKVSTNVTVRHGETIALSGLFNHDQQKDVSKFPVLGHIPILGELFKSRSFVARKSELLIFVTPRIVNPDSERVRRLISDMKERYKKARGEVEFSIFD